MIEGVSVPKEAYISEIDAGWLNFRGKSTKKLLMAGDAIDGMNPLRSRVAAQHYLISFHNNVVSRSVQSSCFKKLTNNILND